MKSLSGVLKQSGHDIFENITTVVGISLLSFAIVSPGIFLFSLPAAVVYLLFTLMPSFAGTLHAMKHKLERKHFGYRLLFQGFRKYYGRAWLFGFLWSILSGILWASWWYFSHAGTVLSFVVAIFQTYFILFVAMATVYTLPVMVYEEKSLVESINASIKLFLQNGLYTFGTLIQLITVSSLLAVTVISVPLLFTGMVSIFLNNVYRNLIEFPEDSRS